MFSFLFKNIKRHISDSILSMVSVIIEGIAEMIIPLHMASLIDKGIEVGNFNEIRYYSIIIFCFVVLQLSTGILCAFFAVRASNGVAYDMRKSLFEKIQEYSFSNIDKFSTGSLVTRLTEDVNQVKQAFQMVIRGALRSVFMSIISIFMAYKIHSGFAMILLVIMPVMILLFVFLARRAMPIFERMFAQIDNLNNVLSENIHGIRVVKAYNREEQQIDLFGKNARNIHDYSIKAEKNMIIFGPFMNLAMFGIILSLSYMGAHAIVESNNNPALGLTTGGIMSLITYSMQMLMSLMMITFIFVMIVISSTSLRRLNEIYTEESDIKNIEEPIKEIQRYDIEYKNVCFKYKNQKDDSVLNNISIKINEGESIGIIGGTGSGKSSFVNLIPRLYDVTKGEVLIGGVNVKNYEIETLRKSVGMVLQKNVLFSGTIASNLRLGNENITYEEMEEACIVSNAYEFIEPLPDKYESIVEQGGSNFSGGQKQRLCIARALLKKPKILIMDDSTSAVDTKTDRAIRQLLFTEYKSTTKIIISQKILSIIDMDKIIVLDDGKIVAFDTHENLLKSCDIYKELYNLQQQN